jgi:protein gp37
MFDKISEGRYWDKPWSLVSGCTRCSPGCDHCWALAMEDRFRLNQNEVGDRQTKVVIRPDRLDIPLKRKKPTVWAVWNDLFHEDVPADFIVSAFMTMFSADQHTYLVLTKRPKRAVGLLNSIWRIQGTNEPYISKAKNVWIGVTACNQSEADEKIPLLLQIQAAVRFVSIEPMLGPVDLHLTRSDRRTHLLNDCDNFPGVEHSRKYRNDISWVVLGGETGAGARPMKTEWVRDVRDQCKAAGVPFFFKAWGPCEEVGRMLYGRTWDELPEAK